ncbi:MAG TPA: methyltransferase domain-containing protein [Longimicrobium sp.]|nr:methyltransferase domain-containing protein [Longimicrobium sp.]
MTEYLDSPIDFATREVAEAFDELPLWSAPFGLLLLDRVPLRRGMAVLDVGCATGFPLLELAQRLGPSSTVVGIDPWRQALDRAAVKLRQYGLRNVRLVEGDAAATGFADESFDLVTSNLGVNNFADPDRVLAELHRVLRPGGHLCVTSNFLGHMAELYRVFRRVLEETGNADRLDALREHEEHRSTLNVLSVRLERAGFRVVDRAETSFRMRFLNGAALLRHYFVRLGFLEGWKEIVPPERRAEVFARLEAELDALAAHEGELALTVPAGYVAAVK